MEIYGISLILNNAVLIKKRYKEEITPIQLEEFKECYEALVADGGFTLIVLFCDSNGNWMRASKSQLEALFLN